MQGDFACVALVVADLDRMTAFYREVLGFEEMQTIPIGNELAHLAGGVELELNERFMRLGGTLINMLHYVKPGLKQSHSVLRDSAGQGPGLSHLVIRVEAIDPVLERTPAFGGTVIAGTRSLLNHPALPGERVDIAQIFDPEGTRIELIQNADVVMQWMRTPKGQWRR
jgi:catechol 2,3-dioxygenase-like lactoylglutathione lyase family enzyme